MNADTTRSAAVRVRDAFEKILGIPVPVRVRCWDGSVSGPDSPATVVFRNRRAIRRVLWSPGELGLVRAYIAGDLEIDGDVYALLSLPGLVNRVGAFDIRDARRALGGVWELARLGGVGLRPRPPAVEVPRRRGIKHSRARDASSVSHHYDVGNAFYRIFLGPSMVYSCAYWDETADGLDAAQRAKLDLVCRKLGLRPGMRLLDVGCGWGSMAIHAARHYGVDVVGVTLSREQAAWARKAAAEAGLSDRLEFRVQDYRDVDDGPFDAISSIGMSEHVGDAALPTYAATLHGLLRPQGRLLNHAIAAVSTRDPGGNDKPGLIQNYIFPDGEILPLSRT
ncbi:cyclopropane-fatty-acyl-phospholipid synthase family protein, partial [Rhodococcus sp. (in: high G+C Gram-positive bacteria)]|uniref:SAM-dependent methyltransferase n=2 Tax=unclassified Rhodococcus (in: high G+C Gram-positive bacteria) TaxID=192944 RepID=UPI0019F3BD04